MIDTQRGMMKIQILCPECGKVLTDRFSCLECSIVVNGTTNLEMECLECEKVVGVEIATKIKLDNV